MFQTIVSWAQSASWGEIAGVLAIWLLAFDKLAKLTPTDADDKAVAFIYKVFAVLAIRVPDVGAEKKIEQVVDKAVDRAISQ